MTTPPITEIASPRTRGHQDLVRQASEEAVSEDPPLLVMVAALALADVIRMKEASGRPKDLVSVPLLRRTLEENRRQEKL